MKRTLIVLAAQASLALAPVSAQVGGCDPNFSGDGRVTYAPAGPSADAFAGHRDLRVESSLLGYVRDLANSYDIEVLRFHSNGNLDLSFGSSGIRHIAFDLERRRIDYPTALWVRFRRAHPGARPGPE